MVNEMSPNVSTHSIEPAPRDPALYLASASSGPSGRAGIRLNGGGEAFAYGAVAEAGKPLVVSTAGGRSDLFAPGEWVAKVIIQYRIDGGTWMDAAVDDPVSSGHIDVPPNARGLEYRFAYNTNTGRTVIDDENGKNFHSDVIPAGGTTICFEMRLLDEPLTDPSLDTRPRPRGDGRGVWQVRAGGPIKAGSTMRLAYDVNRLLYRMEGTYHNGAPAWDINAYISFNGQTAVDVPIVGDFRKAVMTYPEKVPVLPAIKVPENARSATVWFRGSSMSGVYWDSNYGANYTFSVQP